MVDKRVASTVRRRVIETVFAYIGETCWGGCFADEEREVKENLSRWVFDLPFILALGTLPSIDVERAPISLEATDPSTPL